MPYSRQLPIIVATIAVVAVSSTGCIFSPGGGGTSDPSDTGSADDSGPVDAEQEADDTSGERDGADSSESDGGEGDTADIGADCEASPEAEGCPCEYAGMAEGICADQTYDSNGDCPEPENYFEEEGEDLGCGDEIDNDCDGVADENCPCTYDAGEGEGVCEDLWTNDQGECPRPEDYVENEDRATPSEYCDKKDNDCDGTVDELDCGTECSSEPESEGCPCQYDGKSSGVCVGSKYDEDENCIEPSTYVNDEEEAVQNGGDEYCDGKDNDCDGANDEGCPCEFATPEGDSRGLCQEARYNDDGMCVPPDDYQPSGETSCGDDYDNDCDGKTDCNDPDCDGNSCGSGGKSCCYSADNSKCCSLSCSVCL